MGFQPCESTFILSVALVLIRAYGHLDQGPRAQQSTAERVAYMFKTVVLQAAGSDIDSIVVRPTVQRLDATP